MCGIVGYISDVKHTTAIGLKVFRQMLMADSLRGEDSTGVFYGTREGSCGYVKDAIPGWDFLANNRHLKKINANSNAFLVGHNRFATSGAHWDVKGAHPFHHGSITMVHNGTLTNHANISEGSKFTVDSEAICNNINKLGAREAIAELKGAFALVWYDRNSKTLNLIRNSERPLHLFETSQGLFFCSERDMGTWILRRNNVSIQKEMALPVGVLWSIDITTANKFDVTTTTMKVYEAPRFNTTTTTYRGRAVGTQYPKPVTPNTVNGSNTSVIHLGSDSKKGEQQSGSEGYKAESSLADCCICSDRMPKTLMAEVDNAAEDYVCRDCDELYFGYNGEPVNWHRDWIPYTLKRAGY